MDIKHPELGVGTRSLVFVGVTVSDDRVADYGVLDNLLHVVRIEPLNDTKPKRRKKPRKQPLQGYGTQPHRPVGVFGTDSPKFNEKPSRKSLTHLTIPI